MHRLISLRLNTRHAFRGPNSLFTGKEEEFNKAGLFSTNECVALCSCHADNASLQGEDHRCVMSRRSDAVTWLVLQQGLSQERKGGVAAGLQQRQVCSAV